MIMVYWDLETSTSDREVITITQALVYSRHLSFLALASSFAEKTTMGYFEHLT